VAAVALTGAMIVGIQGPAWAGSVSGGALSCPSNQNVVTNSKSAGYTSHSYTVGSLQQIWDYGNVSASNPYRTWATGSRTASSWWVSGQVLESGSGSCKLAANLT